jgi:hypothetical protein
VALLAAALLLPAVGGYLVFPLVDPGPVSPSARLEDRWTGAFQRLNVVRVDARARMAAAATPAARAAEARVVAAAYRGAARSVNGLVPPTDQRDAVARVADKLVLAGRAYDALAAAVTHGDSGEYAADSHVVDARERAVQRALDLLRGPGTAGS